MNMFDFINNLYKKNDHPLARESGVTEIIDELPADNPSMALEELTHWLQALSTTEGINFKERVKRLARIDQSGQKYERTLRRHYTDTSRMHKVIERLKSKLSKTEIALRKAQADAQQSKKDRHKQKGDKGRQDQEDIFSRTLANKRK